MYVMYNDELIFFVCTETKTTHSDDNSYVISVGEKAHAVLEKAMSVISSAASSIGDEDDRSSAISGHSGSSKASNGMRPKSTDSSTFSLVPRPR